VAAKYPSFPILLETSRECVQDVFDLPALREVLGQLRSRAVRVVTVDTPKASPFAQSLLFNWIAAYMYEGDAPLAERRAAALALDRDLLRDLLGAEELRELLDPGVLADLELELQCLTEGRRARDADELHDVLRKVGDLSPAEIDLRCEGSDGRTWTDELLRTRRAIEIGIADEMRIAAAEDAARYRDALGCSLPLGLPRAFTEPVPLPLESLVARYARTHAPFVADDLAARFALPVTRISGALAALEADERLVRGEFRPDGATREWCDVDVLRQLRRRSLAALRREVEPVEPDAYARFLTQWHGIPAERRGLDAVVEALGLVQGSALVASSLETDVLPSRVRHYRPADLDELCTAGEIVWIGAGSVGANDGRVRLFFADQLPLLAPAIEPQEAPRAVHGAIRTLLGQRGASFWTQLRAAAPSATEGELLTAVGSRVGRRGHQRHPRPAPSRRRRGARPAPRGAARTGRLRPGRLTWIGPPAGQGRWSLVAPMLQPVPRPTEAAHAAATQMLERYGVVTREAVLAENVVGGYAGVYGVLKVLEERGQTRRGYFVAGLGAAQFSVPARSTGCVPCATRSIPICTRTTSPQRSCSPPPIRPNPTGRHCRGRCRRVVRPAAPVPWWCCGRAGRSCGSTAGRTTSSPSPTPSTAGRDRRGPARSPPFACATAVPGRWRSARSTAMPSTHGRRSPLLRQAGFVDSYRGLVVRRLTGARAVFGSALSGAGVSSSRATNARRGRLPSGNRDEHPTPRRRTPRADPRGGRAGVRLPRLPRHVDERHRRGRRCHSPVLYQHFDSKQDLYLALIDEVGHRMITAIAKATAGATNGKAQTESGFCAYFRWVAQDHARSCCCSPPRPTATPPPRRRSARSPARPRARSRRSSPPRSTTSNSARSPTDSSVWPKGCHAAWSSGARSSTPTSSAGWCRTSRGRACERSAPTVATTARSRTRVRGRRARPPSPRSRARSPGEQDRPDDERADDQRRHRRGEAERNASTKHTMASA
ncbi:MAG: hypothetical protein R2713_23135, partial [Ilumatobacteraceae bacterium]